MPKHHTSLFARETGETGEISETGRTSDIIVSGRHGSTHRPISGLLYPPIPTTTPTKL
jgi:hypothetical protein